MEAQEKLYFGIKEVADQFGINASKLRYYEKEFPSLKPKKNRSGERVYTQADIEHLTEILKLINEKGLTLSGARDYLKNRDSNKKEIQRTVERLKEIKTFLEQMRTELELKEKSEKMTINDYFFRRHSSFFNLF